MPPSSSDGFGPTDLLCPTPMTRIDRVGARHAISFAFATGAVGNGFETMIDNAPVPTSSWNPADFAADVFLDAFVETRLQVVIEGHAYRASRPFLTRLIACPPSDAEHVRFRQSIFRELVDAPALRPSLEQLYVLLIDLRETLSNRPVVSHHDTIRRRIDIMRIIREVTRTLLDGFALSESGLARLRALGERISHRESYQRMCALLDFEENGVEVDMRLHVGIDGTVRACQALALRENVSNPFHQSRFGRFIARVAWLLRGYRFDDFDLLNRHVDEIAAGLEDDLVDLLQLVGDVEFYLAGMHFRDRVNEAGLEVCLPTLTDDGERELQGLFNPLLLDGRTQVVPCDLRTHQSGTSTIVTGPNSGGKTRLLQSVALAQILGQAGMFVPARSARLPRAQGLFVSVIEHARADQDEGRLGMELLRIRRLFSSTRTGSLVILDELCSGTNPSEGEDIFRLVLGLLPMLRSDAFITTHFLSFASALHQESPELSFLQVELDTNDEPTFQFVQGVATTSLAHRTAERLGVTQNALVAMIRRNNPEVRPMALLPKRAKSRSAA